MQTLASDMLHLLLFLFTSSLLFQSPIRAQHPIYHKCDTAFNYTSGSKYKTNLNLTLTSLAANAHVNGFYITFDGENPDRVYGLIQCHVETSSEACNTCAKNITGELIRLCDNQKEAFIVYHECRLWYSFWRFFSTSNSNPTVFMIYVEQNASNQVVFNNQTRSLMGNLSSVAASDPLKYAKGIDFITTDFKSIYGMVMCTRDLSKESCSSCLNGLLGTMPRSCDGWTSCWLITMSCDIKYDVNPFFELPIAPPPPPPPPPPTPVVDSSLPPLLDDGNSTVITRTKSPNQDGNEDSSRIIAIVVPMVIGLVLAATISACLLWRKAMRKKNEDMRSVDSLLIDLDTLKVATGNFSDANKLGEGGFGRVYKGKLLDGREIAVKRLSRNSTQGFQELKAEIELVAKLEHRNLVRLFGCCLEEQEKMLVYEYLPNLSLDKFIFDSSKRAKLEWGRRYTIILGIAQGLLYLHQDSQLRIIHRDLKASNILLDGDMNPKISDFGLAKLFYGDQTRGTTRTIAGTLGYMAPEYATHGRFSTKSDVFSFGVLVLEIVTGRKNTGFHDSENVTNLLSYVWKHWTNGTTFELVDRTLGPHCSRSEVSRCIQIGLLCVEENATKRPTMSTVLLMLSSYSVTLPVPSKPGFLLMSFTKSNELSRESETSESDQSTNISVPQSKNDLTISELEPR